MPIPITLGQGTLCEEHWTSLTDKGNSLYHWFRVQTIHLRVRHVYWFSSAWFEPVYGCSKHLCKIIQQLMGFWKFFGVTAGGWCYFSCGLFLACSKDREDLPYWLFRSENIYGWIELTILFSVCLPCLCASRTCLREPVVQSEQSSNFSRDLCSVLRSAPQVSHKFELVLFLFTPGEKHETFLQSGKITIV